MCAPVPPAPHRQTTQRAAIVAQLAGTDHFQSAQQLHHALWDARTVRVGLTTTYRILRALTEDGIAETQRGEDGEILYRLRRDTERRHHLICRKCGRTIDFTVAEFEAAAGRLARQHHYTNVTRHLDLYGTCPKCRAIADRPGPTRLR